jgi:hypothetical protein
MTTTTRPLDFLKGDFFTGARRLTCPAGTRVRITETSTVTGEHRVQVWGKPRVWAWVGPADVVTLTPAR